MITATLAALQRVLSPEDFSVLRSFLPFTGVNIFPTPQSAIPILWILEHCGLYIALRSIAACYDEEAVTALRKTYADRLGGQKFFSLPNPPETLGGAHFNSVLMTQAVIAAYQDAEAAARKQAEKQAHSILAHLLKS